MRWFNLLAILFCSFVLPANAQDEATSDAQPVRKRVDLSADTFVGIDSAGTSVQRLVGNVRLSQEQTRLTADRATQYPDRDEILFVGNVVVYERGDTLSSRRVLYNRTTKVGKASGSVRLTDGDVVVTAPSAIYDTRGKRTDFTEGVTLVDSSSVLVSDTGTYWSESKKAAFAGKVRLRTKDATVRADSLDYDRETQVSRARGNVFVHSVEMAGYSSAKDTTAITAIVSDRAINDRKNSTESLSGDVLLFQVRFDSSSVDTLLIRSNALRIVKSDSVDVMFSTGDVRIWNMKTSATADSVMYESRLVGGVRKEIVHMFENPVAWFESTQIYGDTLRISSSDGEPDSMLVVGHTFLAESDGGSGRAHQVKGRDMVGRFIEGGRRRMIVEPNAEALYFMKDGDAPNGAVRTTADRIIFEFVEDEMKHVRAEGGVEGTYFPEGKLPEGNLEGFRWIVERRPDKQELLADQSMPKDIRDAERLGCGLHLGRPCESRGLHRPGR